MTDSSYRLITPEQLNDGYLEYIHGHVMMREYTKVQKHSSGNFIVKEPAGAAMCLTCNKSH